MVVLNRKLYVLFLIVLFTLSCKENLTIPDPEVLGKWTDDNVRFNFNRNMSYGMKFLRIGSQKDTVTTDSAFGEYTVNKTTKTLSLAQTGYKKKNGEIILKKTSASTWNYSVNKDTLIYFSSTTNGKLNRVP